MKNLRYNLDLIFCIDIASGMQPIVWNLKKNIKILIEDLIDCNKFENLRIKSMLFRDSFFDGVDFVIESRFFVLPDENERLFDFINRIEVFGGGNEPVNGLEAVALAIKSEWDNGGDRQRHIIVVWSDASTHPLEKYSSHKSSGMPANFNELTDWWEGQSYMSRTSKRLILFTPDATAWIDIATHWESVIHVPSKAGEGLADVDYKTILSTIVNSI